MTYRPVPTGRAALIVGHPGHELRVHGWMQNAQPLTFVLTDGSGGTAASRIESTTRLLARANCRSGSLFGVATDKQFYQAIIHGRLDGLVELTLQLADSLERHEIDYVVGDSLEGFNPTHDFCRLMISAAVEVVARRTGQQIENYDFLLVGAPDDFSRSSTAETVLTKLDKETLEQKMAALQSYEELTTEIASFETQFGASAFEVECFCKAKPEAGHLADFVEAPFYERFGEQQVAKGRYTQVLRYDKHFRPLAIELWNRTALQAGPRMEVA